MGRLTEVWYDGGTEGGNPGIGYGSYAFIDVTTGRSVMERVRFDDVGGPSGRITNNEAEYLTLIQALHRLTAMYGSRVASLSLHVHGDSQLVVNQITGTFVCGASTMAALCDASRALLGQFESWAIEWVRRDEIERRFGH